MTSRELGFVSLRVLSIYLCFKSMFDISTYIGNVIVYEIKFLEMKVTLHLVPWHLPSSGFMDLG